MLKLFSLPMRLRPASLGSVMLATLFSTVLSPSLWLLQVALSPWIDWKSLLSGHNSPAINLNAFYALVLQLKSLGSLVLLTQILPLLLLCFLLSTVYHWGLLRLFTHVGQQLLRTRQALN